MENLRKLIINFYNNEIRDISSSDSDHYLVRHDSDQVIIILLNI